MYHYVRDLKCSRYPHIKGLDLKHFKEQLEFLQSHYAIIRMEDLLSALSGGDDLPDNAALLTFDDGYIDHYTMVFPMLNKLNLQGSFFPPSKILKSHKLLDVNKIQFTLASSEVNQLFKSLLDKLDYYRGLEFTYPDTKALLVEYAVSNRYDCKEVAFIKYMLQTVLPKNLRNMISDSLFKQFVNVDEAVFAKELYCDVTQLSTMKRNGMFIGLHGCNHEWLGNMETAGYESDISKALNYMDNENLVSKKSWVMCYPYGSYCDGVINYINRNGCVAGLTTKVAMADLDKNNPFLLPRLDTNDFPPKSTNYKKFDKLT